MSYKHEEGFFFSRDDNTRLYFQKWTPKGAKAGRNAIIHHGFGEHSGRYGNVLDTFADSGITFYAMDARGHGKSEGNRGHCTSIDQLRADLESFFDFVEETHKVKKPLLIGHSMGGLITLYFSLKESNQARITGLLTSGAALKVHMGFVQKIKVGIGRTLAKLTPGLTMPAGLDLKFLSHDQAVVDAYEGDPLVHGDISASMGMALLDAGDTVIENAFAINMPIMMIHGQDDGLVPSSGTAEAFENISSKDKTVHIYPGMYHELYNETPERREQVFGDVKPWVLKHLK